MSSRYLIGSDILGADVVIPAAGVTYTDYNTVLAVQQALKARGFDPGKLDGIMGPNTAKALRAMQTALGLDPSGTINYETLTVLRVTAGSAATAAATASSTAQLNASQGGAQSASSFFSRLTAPIPPPVPGAPPPSFLMQPLWPGAPVRVWQAGFGGVAGIALAFGIIMAVRR